MRTLEVLADQASRLQAHADELTQRFQGLSSYEEAARFDSDGHALIQLFGKYKSDLKEFESHNQNTLNDLYTQRSSLPYFKRLFASHSAEKSLKSDLSQAASGISSVDDAIEALYDLIDRTPSSKNEQKQMLSELRLIKKELSTEKRSVNEAMRQIRSKARQDMSSWTGVSGRGAVGSVARLNRMSIRHGKEAALSPHESTKAQIETQLVEIERRINWVSRFQGTEPQVEDHPLRCAYCGRRVIENSPCPGCGSASTTRGL